MNKYLVYTLVNFRGKYYIDIFKVFLKALLAFSDVSAFDLCIIADELTLPVIEKIKEIKQFPTRHYIKVPVDKTLDTALFRKFDIYQHPNYLEYDRILFLDCDIIVQENIMHLFKAIKAKPNKLYVSQEGSIDSKYWTVDAYLPQNLERMKRNNVKSFNSGTFLFIPTPAMRDHFVKAKEFGLNYKGQHFVDQSIFNYYFLRLNIAQISKYLTNKIVMFPDITRFYPDKMLMHLSGIGGYKTKAPRMKKYFKLILEHKRN